jgi:hypothetical protein
VRASWVTGIRSTVDGSVGHRDAGPRRRLAAATCALVLLAGACASEGGRRDEASVDREVVDDTRATTTSTERATTTTELPPRGVDAGLLPFAACDDEGNADISVLDPATGRVEIVVPGLPAVCNGNGSLTDTYVTASGRYLVTLWDAIYSERTFNVVDLTSGAQITVADSDLDAWATASTSTGLNAAERDLTIAGFDRAGDGTVYVVEGTAATDYLGADETTHYFAQDVAALVGDGGVVSPRELADQRWCYESRHWNTDSTACVLWSGSSGSAYVFSAGTSPVTDASEYDLALSTYGGDVGESGWLDASTLIGASVGNRSAVQGGVGQETTTLFELTGDRYLDVWADSRSGAVYLASRTLDGTSTEVYSLAREPGAQPVLVTTLPGDVSPIMI